jgi:glycosyltransferase involved in cell wall biosynthesis
LAVYHILSESEPFSRAAGGASAHWIHGVVSAAGLRDETIVVCPEADDSFDFPYVWVAPEMGKISLLPRPLQHPILWRRRARFYAHLLKGFVGRLAPQDSIYVHNRPEMALAMVWAQQGRLQRNPVVLTINDSQLAQAPRPMVRHVAGRMARVVFPNEFLYRQVFEKYGLHMRVSILPFGADETVFYPPLELSAAHLDRPQIVYVGPLTERQGVHILLDAMRLLMRRGVDAELYVIERPDPGASLNFGAGRQDGGEYLRSLRAMNGTNARFAPYLGSDQVANAMRSAVAVCCPSIGDEGFGLCNVEAMACGVPVAASCVGGIPDVFAEGGGLLVPPSDPVALANAIERLMGKTGLSRILRGEGYENFLRHYCWPRIAAAYETVCPAPSGVAGQSPRRPRFRVRKPGCVASTHKTPH